MKQTLRHSFMLISVATLSFLLFSCKTPEERLALAREANASGHTLDAIGQLESLLTESHGAVGVDAAILLSEIHVSEDDWSKARMVLQQVDERVDIDDSTKLNQTLRSAYLKFAGEAEAAGKYDDARSALISALNLERKPQPGVDLVFISATRRDHTGVI